ncbi:hypothetical protein AB0368_05665 [Actinoplanes sp. NPDC051475]|uniref:hypothetical protein n=1 Tax=Actinoplanes sp. NPDC051475 TaxID=3157225 RepID=UPI00344BF9B1
MDRLDQLFDTASPLLRRVDALLSAGGAPPGHGVWVQLRRVRLLPGDAARAVAALRPADLGDAGPELRADAGACAVLAASLPPPGEWSGTAAEAYDHARQRTADRLSGEFSLGARLQASADLAEALAGWMRTTRDGLASVLAEIVGSAEAIVLAADKVDITSPREIMAAADAGEKILEAVADAYDEAVDLVRTSSELAEPLAAGR